nr:SH3 domain-containing protein [uncultured Agathobaculum sp.]
MSSKDQSRRTTAEVVFDGTDISRSILPYLLSMTYTDNEEDEADDLQIKLLDRDNIWLEKWLNDAIDAAASTTSTTGNTAGGTYSVTANSGLNVRSGPGTSYSILGALAYGSSITVSAVENGWATINYSGKTAYVSASYIKQGGKDSSGSGSAVTSALKISAVYVRENWNGDGVDKVLDCGQFELDTVKASGPPATITIKATSLPFNAQIRQTKKTKAWESYKLSGIARGMAAENGMACLYESANDPYYERVEQFQTSDIGFLSQLCHDAGISLKITNNIVVLFDQVEYEKKNPSFTVKRGDGSYTKYDLSVGKADSEYTSCRVRYANPNTGSVIEGIAYVEDYKEDSDDNQQLEVTAAVSSIAEAQALAEKRLRLHNKYSKTATFTFPGDPDKIAGVTAVLIGWGSFDGKYIIKQSKHTLNHSGYTTQVSMRRVLEGY